MGYFDRTSSHRVKKQRLPDQEALGSSDFWHLPEPQGATTVLRNLQTKTNTAPLDPADLDHQPTLSAPADPFVPPRDAPAASRGTARGSRRQSGPLPRFGSLGVKEGRRGRRARESRGSPSRRRRRREGGGRRRRRRRKGASAAAARSGAFNLPGRGRTGAAAAGPGRGQHAASRRAPPPGNGHDTRGERESGGGGGGRMQGKKPGGSSGGGRSGELQGDEAQRNKKKKKKVSCFSNIKIFLVSECALMLAQGTVGAYLVSVLTTLERRFNLQSADVGVIASSFEIGNLALILFVSYFGARGHRPRLIGCGGIVMALGALLSALPEFLTHQYKYEAGEIHWGAEGRDVCATNGSSSDEGPDPDLICRNRTATNMMYLLLIGAQVLLGIGATPVQPLGVSYIDDHVRRKDSSLYIGDVLP
nr:solute carrier organic anion transporter family member 3A1-like [Meriones unguiculatus]